MNGQRLKDLRTDKDMTQREVADEIGVKTRTYAGYEREEFEARDEIKKLLAKYFNVSVDYLIGASEIMNPAKGGPRYLRIPETMNDVNLLAAEKYISFLHSTQKDK